jgi:ribosome-binding protein aMBF1 (putative translation factor)
MSKKENIEKTDEQKNKELDKAVVKEIGRVIRALRKEKRLSSDDLAHKVNITRAYMGRIERGEAVVSSTILLKISHHLGHKAFYNSLANVRCQLSHFYHEQDSDE